MKFFILALVSLTSYAAELNVAGNFSLPHQISFLSYESKEACEADQGIWGGEDGGCVFDAADVVTVTPAANNKFLLEVSTITTNAHMCNFEAEGVLTGNTLVASAPSEIWNGDQSKPATCVVTATYLDGNTVNVTTNGAACRWFCGANANLEIQGAKRK